MSVDTDAAYHALPRWLLVAGLLVGIGAAATGVLRSQRGGELPEHAIARVNDRLILRDAWLRAVAAVASERRTPLTAEDKRHILDRLIDEELLVQHGVTLGLVEQDRRLRGQLVSDVLMAVRAEASAESSDEHTLRRFYQENMDFFTPPARLRVIAYRLGADGRRSPFVPPLPDALLPPAKLRTYLGPALTAVAMQLQPGQSSEPLGSEGGQVVLEVVEREPGAAPPFAELKQEVQAELQRRSDEAAVRRLLAELRENQGVVIREELE